MFSTRQLMAVLLCPPLWLHLGVQLGIVKALLLCFLLSRLLSEKPIRRKMDSKLLLCDSAIQHYIFIYEIIRASILFLKLVLTNIFVSAGVNWTQLSTEIRLLGISVEIATIFSISIEKFSS